MKFVHLALIGLVSAARLHQSDVGLAKRAEHANANAKFNSGALVQVTNSDDAAASTDAEEAENGKSATMNKGQQGNAKKNENGQQKALAQLRLHADQEETSADVVEEAHDNEAADSTPEEEEKQKGQSALRNKGQQGNAKKNENGTQHTLAQKESEAEEEKEVDEDVASAGSEVKGNSANRNKGQQGAAMKALHANANASHKRED